VIFVLTAYPWIQSQHTISLLGNETCVLYSSHEAVCNSAGPRSMLIKQLAEK